MTCIFRPLNYSDDEEKNTRASKKQKIKLDVVVDVEVEVVDGKEKS